MAVTYWTGRPESTAAIVWTGTNITEISGFLYQGISIVDNHDGTATVNRYGNLTVVQNGQAVAQDGTVITTAQWQQLPAQACTFNVTAG